MGASGEESGGGSVRRIQDSTVSPSRLAASGASHGRSIATSLAISFSSPRARPALAALGSGGMRVSLPYGSRMPFT